MIRLKLINLRDFKTVPEVLALRQIAIGLCGTLNLRLPFSGWRGRSKPDFLTHSNPMDHAVQNALMGTLPPFEEPFNGVSLCYGCGRWSAFPELSFCQGSNHQLRRSRCRKNYVLDGQGNKCTAATYSTKHTEQQFEDARVMLDAIKDAMDTRAAVTVRALKATARVAATSQPEDTGVSCMFDFSEYLDFANSKKT
jgi:hypothetical protein